MAVQSHPRVGRFVLDASHSKSRAFIVEYSSFLGSIPRGFEDLPWARHSAPPWDGQVGFGVCPQGVATASRGPGKVTLRTQLTFQKSTDRASHYQFPYMSTKRDPCHDSHSERWTAVTPARLARSPVKSVLRNDCTTRFHNSPKR